MMSIVGSRKVSSSTSGPLMMFGRSSPRPIASFSLPIAKVRRERCLKPPRWESLATDVPGCREVVEDGQNGFLCRVKDARDLATKMIAVMEMAPVDKQAMGEASRRKMERQFDERLVIDAYLGRLEAAVGAGASSGKRSLLAR